MPIDICNIIISYINEVEQIYDNGLKYRYNDISYGCYDERIICMINSTLHAVRICNTGVCVANVSTGKYAILPLAYVIFRIKYSNALVCEDTNGITIYDITNTKAKKINSIKLLPFCALLYADTNYIITDAADVIGIDIYNSDLEPIKTIATDCEVSMVALVDDVLSYCVNSEWFPIEL
jgi:hypothetical protein